MNVFRFEGQSINLPLDTTTATMGNPRTVKALYVHASNAPTTSENLTLTLDSHKGADYDTVLYALDMAAGSTVDVANLDLNAPLHPDDKLRITYANSDANTISYQIITEG